MSAVHTEVVRLSESPLLQEVWGEGGLVKLLMSVKIKTHYRTKLIENTVSSIHVIM